MYKIISKEIINSTVNQISVQAPFIARKCQPGQFIILRAEENGERIPLTISDFDREANTINLIYQVMGHTTRVLSKLNAGDSLVDIVGPLGKPTELPTSGKIIGIGGGVGTAPLLPQLRQAAENGVIVDLILGGRSEEFIILEDKFKKFCRNIYITTDDGSRGLKGLVTDQLDLLLKDGEKYDEVITIGPVIMMKFVCLLTKKWDIKTSVSLNPIMVDGTGMCGACRVSIGDETKFACVDGPDFDGHLVNFDELMSRLRTYNEAEAKINELDQQG